MLNYRMAAAGAGGRVPPPVQEPLQLVDYDIPEVAAPEADFSESIRRIKETGPWFRIRPETAKYGNVYYLVTSPTPAYNKYVEKSAEMPTEFATDDTVRYWVQFRALNNPYLYEQWINAHYDEEGRHLGGNSLLVYAKKEEMPIHLIVGPRGRQYREALVRTFGPVNAINMSMANVSSNAKKRRANALSTRRMGGRRRRSRRR